ncbi:GNAT family N-acetyltransferase [Flavobacterium cerinum]|uniref:GNAT family N-acetyltransferase n=1 Tax=Flavobacterium cerinum TaxID=2502784 RepID=A0ABY5IW77_9FLAO|nr:GNAT family N-acetyltransferase [Flavobacterium cerinum]UUC47065.1 GNAT family N-acetyltransferase [Flavobacterium cerinum]
MNLNIRPYHSNDKSQLMTLIRLNIPDYFAPDEEADFEEYLEHHLDYYFVVEVDGIILGSGGFNRTEDLKTAKISWDLFHPDSQGKGLGSALTRFRIQEIQKLGGIQLISVRTSQLVYPFYEKFGFETKEIVKDFWDIGFDLVRMERPLFHPVDK